METIIKIAGRCVDLKKSEAEAVCQKNMDMMRFYCQQADCLY